MTDILAGHSSPEMRKAGALMLIPCLVIAALYIFIPRPRMGTQLESLRERMASALQGAPTVEMESRARAKLDSLRQRAESMRLATEGAATAPSLASRGGLNPSELEALGRWISSQGLMILEEEHVDAANADSDAGDVLRQLQSTEYGRRTIVRRIRFAGSYLRTIKALRDLIRTYPGVAVGRIRMVVPEDGGQPIWTLVLA